MANMPRKQGRGFAPGESPESLCDETEAGLAERTADRISASGFEVDPRRPSLSLSLDSLALRLFINVHGSTIGPFAVDVYDPRSLLSSLHYLGQKPEIRPRSKFRIVYLIVRLHPLKGYLCEISLNSQTFRENTF